MVKEQLLRAKQSLEAEPAAAATTADSDGAAAQHCAPGGAAAGKAQQRAKKADDYHARHKEWVAQFNELTGGECAGGEGGVKWAAVRAWQQKHWQLNNLLAGGLVGPKTLEAAKLLAQENAPKKEGADDKQAGGEKGHAEPRPGEAEGAEASADKPNLEGDVDAEVAPTSAGAASPSPLASKKTATLVEFDSAATKLDALIAQFKQPEGQGPQKPIADHYVEGTDDKDAPPALGAMMKTEVLKGYAEAAKELGTKWSDLGTAHARAQFLLNAVNDAIAAENVPAIKGVILLKISNPGEFVASDWYMRMNKPIFEATMPKDVDEVASQVFHEGRHAEQRFQIARLVAGNAKSVEDVMQGAGVEQGIATQAFEMRSHPLPPEQEKAAQRFKQATVDNPDHKNIEHSSELITDAANQAAALFRTLSPEDQAIASARWQELRQRAIAALESYYHLATERDAYAAQKQLAAATQ